MVKGFYTLLIAQFLSAIADNALLFAAIALLAKLNAPSWHEPLLREFDMYEACGEGFAEPTEYVRRVLPITRAEGGAAEAWTYLYNWPVEKLPRIESGRFGPSG